MPGAYFATFQYASLAVYLNGSRIGLSIESGTIVQNTDNSLTAFGVFLPNEGTFMIGDVATARPFLGTISNPSGSLPVLDDQHPTESIYFVFSPSAGTVFPDTLPTITSGGFLTCFAEGTLISTAQGPRPVENLSIADTIYTASGRPCDVKWIGRQTVYKLFCGQRMQPVRIQAGALGDGLPHTDLTVTADHGMIVDGLVINASALVNGTTIDWVPLAELPDSFTVYHVETEDHDVILANGAAAETFIDYVGRAAFDNHGEYLELYGCERIIPEMARPRISTPRLLPDAIKARLGIFGGTAAETAPVRAVS